MPTITRREPGARSPSSGSAPRRRIRLLLIVLTVLVLPAGTLGYLGFGRFHREASLAGLIEVYQEFPSYRPSAQWTDSSTGCAPTDTWCAPTAWGNDCGPSRCDERFHLEVPREDHSTAAGSSLFGMRAANGAEALRRFAFWLPDDWSPRYQWPRPVPMPSAAATHADVEALNCYTFVYQDRSDRCLWTYWAVYGQYLVGISYGSEVRYLTPEGFVNSYVEVLDRRITELLGLAG